MKGITLPPKPPELAPLAKARQMLIEHGGETLQNLATADAALVPDGNEADVAQLYALVRVDLALLETLFDYMLRRHVLALPSVLQKAKAQLDADLAAELVPLDGEAADD